MPFDRDLGEGLRRAARELDPVLDVVLERGAEDLATALRRGTHRDTGRTAAGWRAEGSAVVNHERSARFAPVDLTGAERVLDDVDRKLTDRVGAVLAGV